MTPSHLASVQFPLGDPLPSHLPQGQVPLAASKQKSERRAGTVLLRSFWPHRVNSLVSVTVIYLMTQFLGYLKKKKKNRKRKKRRTFCCFLFVNTFRSLSISKKQASTLDMGKEREKIKEVISYFTNSISHFPMKGGKPGICQILSV